MKWGGKDKTAKDGEAGSSSTAGTPIPSVTGLEEEESPPNSRKSRDARSMTTNESSLLESGRTSSDLARTPSYSNNSFDGSSQQTATSSPSFAGTSSKESLFNKITRKSSSGKFGLPNFKREKSRLEPLTPSQTSEPRNVEGEEEEGSELAQSVSSLREKEGGKGEYAELE